MAPSLCGFVAFPAVAMEIFQRTNRNPAPLDKLIACHQFAQSAASIPMRIINAVLAWSGTTALPKHLRRSTRKGSPLTTRPTVGSEVHQLPSQAQSSVNCPEFCFDCFRKRLESARDCTLPLLRESAFSLLLNFWIC